MGWYDNKTVPNETSEIGCYKWSEVMTRASIVLKQGQNLVFSDPFGDINGKTSNSSTQ